MNEALIEKISELKRKILTLEWDKRLGQIDFSKNHLLEEYKKQLSDVEAK